MPWKLVLELEEDIGRLYNKTHYPKPDGKPDGARQLWTLLTKQKLDASSNLRAHDRKNERFLLVTRYIGNGGNPYVLAKWLCKTGALRDSAGDGNNVEEVCGLLEKIRDDTLRDKRTGLRYTVWQIEHGHALRNPWMQVPPIKLTEADKEMYNKAINLLWGGRKRGRQETEYEKRLVVKKVDPDDPDDWFGTRTTGSLR